MTATVDLDKVLDLVFLVQEETLQELSGQMNGTVSYRVLWESYQRLSGLYDDIRRAANDD